MRWCKVAGLEETEAGAFLIIEDTNGTRFVASVERIYTEDERFAQECIADLRLKFPSADKFIETVHDWSVYKNPDGDIDKYSLYVDARAFLGRN
jgi:hypothetical protein